MFGGAARHVPSRLGGKYTRPTHTLLFLTTSPTSVWLQKAILACSIRRYRRCFHHYRNRTTRRGCPQPMTLSRKVKWQVRIAIRVTTERQREGTCHRYLAAAWTDNLSRLWNNRCLTCAEDLHGHWRNCDRECFHCRTNRGITGPNSHQGVPCPNIDKPFRWWKDICGRYVGETYSAEPRIQMLQEEVQRQEDIIQRQWEQIEDHQAQITYWEGEAASERETNSELVRRVRELEDRLRERSSYHGSSRSRHGRRGGGYEPRDDGRQFNHASPSSDNPRHQSYSDEQYTFANTSHGGDPRRSAGRGSRAPHHDPRSGYEQGRRDHLPEQIPPPYSSGYYYPYPTPGWY